MPGFNSAGPVTRLILRMNSVGLTPQTGMQTQEAFRAGEGAKAARIQEEVKAPPACVREIAG